MHRARATKGVLLTLVGVLCAAVDGCRHERDVGVAPPAESSVRSVVPESSGAYPPANIDLSADRLSERVDGAEAKLRALGCRRLMVWRLGAPPSDLEVYRFDAERGARQMLSDEAGAERTSGLPGEEGWLGTNVVYFRAGAVYVRLIADAPQPREILLEPVERFASALGNKEVVP